MKRDITATATRVKSYYVERRLGGLRLGRWTHDQKFVGSTPGRVAVKWLLLGWVTLRTGKPSRYVTNQQGQLSLPSFRRR